MAPNKPAVFIRLEQFLKLEDRNYNENPDQQTRGAVVRPINLVTLNKRPGSPGLTLCWRPKALCTSVSKIVGGMEKFLGLLEMGVPGTVVQNPLVKPWFALQLDWEKVKISWLTGLWKSECLRRYSVKKLCLLYLSVSRELRMARNTSPPHYCNTETAEKVLMEAPVRNVSTTGVQGKVL